MQKENGQLQRHAVTREGVRRVLVEQYAFHEARNRPNAQGDATKRISTAPGVHALADIYKCLHQGEFGIGHSIEDPYKFAGLLRSELLIAQPIADEPILENVSPNDAVFRINLRPYRQRFLGRERSAAGLLLEVCFNSAATHKGSEENFATALELFRDLNDNAELALDERSYVFPSKLVSTFLAEVDEFIRITGTIPVLSHSPGYKKYNAPSYRVVDRETLEKSDLAFLIQEPQ